MPGVTGWDIGGANVKAVRVTVPGGDRISGISRTASPGTTVSGNASLGKAPWAVDLREPMSSGVAWPRVIVKPFALWRERDRLIATLTDIGVELGASDVMGITMTAELADCFATKSDGVRFVLDAFRRAFPDAAVWVYGLDGSFHVLEAARHEPLRFAAANWLATANWVAKWLPNALLLDIGSTTTDIVPLVLGRVEARGRTDTERLAIGELVYTGILRTPVSALVRRVPLRGGWCPVAAEHFAIAADAHVWLRCIEPHEYTCETPDGRGTTLPDARRRLARVICADDTSLTADEITRIARRVATAQRRIIATAVGEVLARLGSAAPTRAVIAGSGYRLAAAVARRAGLEPAPLADRFGDRIATAAPSAAVAHLLALKVLNDQQGSGREQ